MSPTGSTPNEILKAKTTADIVTVPARTVVALDGQGAPESAQFEQSIQAIYGTAYTLKFTRKKKGGHEFKIGPLEARWWTDDPSLALPQVTRDAWRWQLRLTVPEDVTTAELASAVDTATHRKGGKLEGNAAAARVQLLSLPKARMGRTLHIGPYATEGASIRKIAETLDLAGLESRNAHIEVYLNDPRRVDAQALKTVLLLEAA
jgi:hypothetical protein